MPALAAAEAVPYVIAAYGSFGVLVAAYVSILHKRTARRRREPGDDEL